VNGLVGLVPLAELIAEMTGSRPGATNLALRILQSGAAGLPAPHDDTHVATRYELVAAGVVTEAGVPVHGRAAELITVCELLAASTVPSPTPPADPRLVCQRRPARSPSSTTSALMDWSSTSSARQRPGSTSAARFGT
jgi:hypothetical protein